MADLKFHDHIISDLVDPASAAGGLVVISTGLGLGKVVTSLRRRRLSHGPHPHRRPPPPVQSAPETTAEIVPAAERDEGSGEEEPLIQTAECRICQEEDSLKDLETGGFARRRSR